MVNSWLPEACSHPIRRRTRASVSSWARTLGCVAWLPRSAYMRFAQWLRAERSFPTRLPVYLNPGPVVRSPEGVLVVGLFFVPYDKAEVPFISVATGDYRALRRAHGRDDALASLLFTLCHELQHYDQWCAGRPQVERGVNAAARRLLHRYSAVTEHP